MSSADESPPSPHEYCDMCGTLIPPSGSFCPRCGALRASLRRVAPQYGYTIQTAPAGRPALSPPTRRPPSWRLIIKTVLAFGMITFVVQLLAGLAALVYGTQIVLPEIVDRSFTIYVIAPLLMAVGEISGNALGAYYLFIVAAILLSAAWFFLSSAKVYHKELTMKGTSRRHSAIFDLCGLMFAVLFLNIVIVLVYGALWEEPPTPTEGAELWELLFLLANASVWEELIVRVLLIGVPMLLIDFARHKLSDRKHVYILGGGFTFGVPEVTLVLISSALFGLAHFDGWGAWKVFPSAVAGVAFGYMFMRHGLASAIMLHFGFDYLSMPTEVFFESSDTGAFIILGLAILAWVAMGGVFLGYYVIRIFEFLTGRLYFEERPPEQYPFYYRQYDHYVQQPPSWQAPPSEQTAWQPATEPAPQRIPPIPGSYFVCPACGYTEARWIDGRFQCLRCGTIV